MFKKNYIALLFITFSMTTNLLFGVEAPKKKDSPAFEELADIIVIYSPDHKLDINVKNPKGGIQLFTFDQLSAFFALQKKRDLVLIRMPKVTSAVLSKLSAKEQQVRINQIRNFFIDSSYRKIVIKQIASNNPPPLLEFTTPTDKEIKTALSKFIVVQKELKDSPLKPYKTEDLLDFDYIQEDKHEQQLHFGVFLISKHEMTYEFNYMPRNWGYKISGKLKWVKGKLQFTDTKTMRFMHVNRR